MCVVSAGVAEQILVAYPDADINGDGALSREEVCAYQERMRQQGDESAAVGASFIDPEVDTDGDGVLTSAEIVAHRQRMFAPAEAELAECQSCACEDVAEAGAAPRADNGKICRVDE